MELHRIEPVPWALVGTSRLVAEAVSGVEGGCGQGPVDEMPGDVGEEEVVVAGVVAEAGEGFFHGQGGPFGEDAFGLFDDDAAVEGAGELFVDDLGFAGGAVL